MRRHGVRRRTLAVLGSGLAAMMAAGAAFAADPLERFTAFAVDPSAQAAGSRTGTVDISIDHWSSDAERDRLLSAIREGGTDSLLRELQKIKKPAGYIQTPGNVGYPIRFARQIPTSDGGRRVLLGTDRPISFLEASNPSVTSQYPFMIVDLRLDAKGEGQGRLLPLARVTADPDHVVDIENYTSEPVRLSKVRRVK